MASSSLLEKIDFNCFLHLQVRIERIESDESDQRRLLSDLSRVRQHQSTAHTLPLLRNAAVRPPDLPDPMADGLGNEFLRAMQIPVHYAVKNQAFQRGKHVQHRRR